MKAEVATFNQEKTLVYVVEAFSVIANKRWRTRNYVEHRGTWGGNLSCQLCPCAPPRVSRGEDSEAGAGVALSTDTVSVNTGPCNTYLASTANR